MLPSKVIKIRESILWKLPDIINILQNEHNIRDAYHKAEKKQIDINEFEFSIDILYLLDMIEIKDEEGNYQYVKGN